MDERIEQLRARQQELTDDSAQIIALADSEKRDLTDEESDRIEANNLEFRRVDRQISQRVAVIQQTMSMDESQGRRTEPGSLQNSQAQDDHDDGDEPSGPSRPDIGPRGIRASSNGGYPRVSGMRPAGMRSGSFQFRSFGELAQAVYRASIQGGRYDPRLDNAIHAAATTYGETSVGEQGGFLIAPDFSTEIAQKVTGEGTLLSRTDQMTAGGNTFTFPADETTPWQTTGGIQAHWEGEGQTITPSRPALEQKSVRLNKLTALVNVTEELLEDTSALDAYLRQKAPQKMNFKIDLAIIQGNGVGQPLGIMNSPALVTQGAEGSQTADTVVFENFRKMWGRLYAGCRQRAVWLMNQDVETALPALEFPSTAGTFPVFLPPGGLSGSPLATLMGRPIIPTEACNEIGDAGDVILADLSSYLTIRKAAGLRTDTSIHLYFDQDIMSFRFIFRVGGLPWWGAPITRRDGSNTLSCFVTLAERG